MSLSFNSTSKGGATAGTTVTVSHTIAAGDDRILLVGTSLINGTSVSGVTYGGVSMTQAISVQPSQAVGGAERVLQLFYLLNPDVGTANIVVTKTSGTATYCHNVAYNGVNQSSFPDASANGGTTSSTLTLSPTTVADNTWVVMFAYGTAGFPVSGGTGVGATRSTTTDQGNALSGAVFDSNADVTPPGSYSIAATEATITDVIGVAVSIAPPSGAVAGGDALLLAGD